MMEACSELPPPCEEEVKSIVFKDVKKKNQQFDDSRLREVIDDEFQRFGGIKGLGSMAGWLMHSRVALTNSVIMKMEAECNKNLPTETTDSLYSNAL